MKILRFTFTFLSLFLLLPIDMMAGGELIFSDFKMNDGDICSMPIKKDKIEVTFKDETVKYNKQLKAMTLPKGTVITISAPKGEIISGLSLRPSGKSLDMKDFLSCETGKFEHGFWNGSAKNVTFRCLKDCDISKIRASFKTDAPEAYVGRGLLDSDYRVLIDGQYYNLLEALYFAYDEKKNLRNFLEDEEGNASYSIDDNSEYPTWYNKGGFVIIESSFANYRPKTTSHWFDGMGNVDGLENLNTSETTNMSYMFANFDFEIIYKVYYDPSGEGSRLYANNNNESFFSTIFGLNFSNVKDMNHMFYKCNMPNFTISSLHINSKTNTTGLFEDSNVEYITLNSTDISLNDNFFDGVGTKESPCVIETPNDFNFGMDTSVEQFQWKGGIFRGFILKPYAINEIEYDPGYGYGGSIDNSLTFYYDTKKYIRNKQGFTYYTSDPYFYYSLREHYKIVFASDLDDKLYASSWMKFDYNNYELDIKRLTISFDESFKKYKPLSTYKWLDFSENNGFYGESILNGLENLDMSETTNTARMFCCLPIFSLDLSMLDMSKVVRADSMFYGCSNLEYFIFPNKFSNSGIADYMFSGCTSLPSIVLPNNCTKIGVSAFSNCESFESITIPNSVTSIGDKAFLGCSGLTSVILGNMVDEIGSYAFSDCNNLATVTSMKASPAKISPNTFPNRSNQTLYVPYGCKSYYLKADYWREFKNIVELSDGIIDFADATIKSICVKNWDTNGDGELSHSEAAAVTSLGMVFRYNDSITSFNELQYFTSLKSIGDEAFYWCHGLASVTIPNSVTSIGNGAFSWCYGLASVTIPNSVTSIGDEAFTWCGMTSLYIPKSVTSIGEGAFVRCPMTSIIVDTANPKYDSQDNCNALIETASNTLLKGGINTIIPNSVTSIGDWAFGGCTRLTSINIPNSVTTIGEAAFTECGLTSVTIPNSVTSIGNGAFSITNLTSVTIPNSVTNLGDNVFWDCPLVSVTVENPIPFAIGSDTFSEIPDNVILYVPFGSKTAYQEAKYWKDFKNIVEYGDIPFVDASVKSFCINNWDTNGDGELSLNEAASVTSLGTVFKSSKITSFNELQYFTGLTSINEGAFSSSTIKEVTLPETVTSLAKDAFLYCKSLTAIHFPSALASIGQNALSGCSAMTAITVDEANENFCDIDGVLFNKDKTTLVQFPASKSTNYTVPEGTKVIGRDAFYYSQLTLVTLPESLEELGYDAFGYSKALAEMNIPEGVTSFGPYAFDGCSALKNVYCDITAPYAIDKNNFSTKAYSNATLHVLPYLVDTYKNLEGWKYFANIKGDVIDYAVTAEATTINLGETAILPVLVASSGEIDGMQFDFTLPAGVTVATDMVGGLVVTTTDRTKKLTATCVKIADNTYRAILLSINRAIVAAGEGAVLNIQLQCADDATGGDYDIAFTNVSVSRVEGDKSVNVKVADFTAPLTVVEISKILGDVDGNFTVDVTDVMIIVDYILNRPCNNFNFANADLDGDETINVTDAMNVVNIILHKSNARVSPTAQKIDRGLLHLGTSEMGCQLHTAFDSPQITALQMEVTLPEGCRLNNVSLTGRAARSHMVKTYQLSEGTYNLVVFSIKGSILDTDTPFLQLDLEGNGGLVKIENILCTDTNHKSLTSPDLSAEVTGITVVTADENSTPVYNLSGQRLTKPRKGINITNGKKVVVK